MYIVSNNHFIHFWKLFLSRVDTFMLNRNCFFPPLFLITFEKRSIFIFDLNKMVHSCEPQKVESIYDMIDQKGCV